MACVLGFLAVFGYKGTMASVSAAEPKVMVTDYKIKENEVVAGGTFTLEVTIKNTADKKISNLKMAVASEGGELLGTFTWAIYKEYLKGQPSKRPISTVVPVNLRPYFNSNTTKNFFAVVSAYFKPEKDTYTFEDVLHIIADSLKEQINKENLEKLLSYNVSNEVNFIIRAVPRVFKSIAMRRIYKASLKANTSTITNLGVVSVDDMYKEYIDRFHVVLSMSKGQFIKGSVISYKDTLVFTFSSAIRETFIQKEFFRQMVRDGIHVSIESNGVYYE